MNKSNVKRIYVSKDKFALVDEEYYYELNYWFWHLVDGYAARTRTQTDKGIGRRIWMHRVVADTPKGMETDHINHNRLDNRRCNLRIVTTRQNQLNQKKKNKSGYIGVYWHKHARKWASNIHFKGKTIHLGYSHNALELSKIYEAASRKYYG